MAVIYRIFHKETGKSYVGATAAFDLRKREHLSKLRNNKHSQKIQADWNKNPECMIFEILENVKQADIEIRERFWIFQFDSIESGYNYRKRVAQLSDSSLDQISLSLKGRARPQEVIDRISAAQIGRPKPDGFAAIMSQRTSQTRWFTDGKTTIKLNMNAEVPKGFRRGRTLSRRF